MPQGEGRGALKPRVDKLGEGKNVSINTQICSPSEKLPFLPYMGSSAPYSPSCREGSFSETKGQSLGRPVGGYRFVGMPQGRVAWYSANLGHGFIIPDDRGPKPFVRREGIKAGEEQTLENNDRVSYEVFEGPEGLEAKGVSKVSEQ
jgi:cold shock protein